VQEKNGRIFILGCFYIILNLEVERISVSLLVSSGLHPDGVMHTPMLTLRYPKSMGGLPVQLEGKHQ
jgi:hypothetical protein